MRRILMEAPKYRDEVAKIAALMLRRRALEVRGEMREGWFEANCDLLDELRRAERIWPAKIEDIYDDAVHACSIYRRVKHG